MEDLTLDSIAKELHELNENIKWLTNMLEHKMGGPDYDSLNVTLYTDDPIKVINAKEEK